MRIAHLDTEISWRGGEQQILYLAENLRKSGDENLVVCRPDSVLKARMEGQGFECFDFSPLIEWDVFAASFLGKKLVRERFDIIHAHTAHAAALGALASWGSNIPLIVSRRVDFHLSKNPLTHWKYRRASKILAVSSAVRDILIQDRISPEKIEVVHDGIDLNRWGENSSLGSREELGLPDSGPLIGQIAALAPHKDPLNFLESAALLSKVMPEARAVMVGEGPMGKEVRREISQRGLSRIVFPLGFRSDVHQILRHLDVCVLSSCLEGLGSSLLDALAAKIPVVATRTGGIPEIIEDGVSGLLVPPRDPEALALAIGRVLRDFSLRETLRAGGLEKVKRFEAASMSRQTRSIYRRVLE